MLLALERELVEATDAEIAEAAQDLGMNLAMKGSAAFIGLKYPSRSDIRAFFEALFGPEGDQSGWFGPPPASRKLGPAEPGSSHDENGFEDSARDSKHGDE